MVYWAWKLFFLNLSILKQKIFIKTIIMNSSLCILSSKRKKMDSNQNISVFNWIKTLLSEGIFLPGHWCCDANSTRQVCWKTWIWILALPLTWQTASTLGLSLPPLHLPFSCQKGEASTRLSDDSSSYSSLCSHKVLHNKASFHTRAKKNTQKALYPLPTRSLRSRVNQPLMGVTSDFSPPHPPPKVLTESAPSAS